MGTVTALASVAARPRGFVGVTGPQAGDYLQRMLSNDVLALGEGESCDALLLTPKARVIATARVLRRAPDDDFLLMTEPELSQVLSDALQRTRFAARCEIGVEEHSSFLAFGAQQAPESAWLVPNPDYGTPCVEVVGVELPAGVTRCDSLLERLRIEAGTPVFGREIDDRVLPAEAGLDTTAVSFTKGCYPGQEPVARLHYRGHVNRSLRLLHIESAQPPPMDAGVVHGEKAVGRVTSSALADHAIVALGYVREDVPLDAVVSVLGAKATMSRPARP
jgi:folate-binding protein YgfZ